MMSGRYVSAILRVLNTLSFLRFCEVLKRISSIQLITLFGIDVFLMLYHGNLLFLVLFMFCNM